MRHAGDAAVELAGWRMFAECSTTSARTTRMHSRNPDETDAMRADPP
jgi:hypothetical protein